MCFYVWDPFMVRHHPGKFGGYSHCGSRDTMFAVAQGNNCTCPRRDPPLLFISEAHGMPCSNIRISGRGHINFYLFIYLFLKSL